MHNIMQAGGRKGNSLMAESQKLTILSTSKESPAVSSSRLTKSGPSAIISVHCTLLPTFVPAKVTKTSPTRSAQTVLGY